MAVATSPVGEMRSPGLALDDRARSRRVAAVLVVSVSWALVLAALVLTVLFGLPLVGGDMFTVSYLLGAFIYGPVSALLIWRRVGLVGVILAILAVGSALSAIGAQYAQLSVVVPGLPGVWFAQHVLDRLWLPGTLASFAFLPLLLTRGRIGLVTKVLCWIGAVASTLPVVVAIVRQRPGSAPNPLALPNEDAQAALVIVFYTSLTIVAAIAAITAVLLLWRFVRGSEQDRRGLGWLIIGQWLLVIFFTPSLIAWFPNIAYLLRDYAPFALPLAQLFMPAAILVLALGQRLWGLDVALNRAVVWILLVPALLLAYATVALLLSSLLPVPPTIAGVFGVAALALSVEPARRWVQRRVDALVYGNAAEPAQLMRALGAELPGGGSDLRALVDALRVTLRLGSLSVESCRPDGTSVHTGTPAGGVPTIVPLRNSHALIGTVTATAGGPQSLDRRTVRVLEDVAGVLAVVLQLSDMNRETLQARDRILEVRDEERRMVRRELHDGLAPALATTVAHLDRVPTLADPSAAIAAIRIDLAARTNDVRDLARTLLPGALDSGDLDAALRELAARFSSAGLDITVEFGEPGDLDATRQAAIYHVAAEAVLLARRTESATAVSISVESDEHAARIVVRHNGDATASDTAVVLTSIRDRADDLGGSVEASCLSDGLILSVEVSA